jgi:hypothetical protein
LSGPDWSHSKRDEALEAAVARLPRVAEGIAGMPPEQQSPAFDIAERTYLQTALESDYPEEVAKNWVSAMMFRLRAEVEKRRGPAAL